MATSMQPAGGSRKVGRSYPPKTHMRWSKAASVETGRTAGYLEKQVYGDNPIHNRVRAILRAALQVQDHSTVERILEGIEQDVIDGAIAILAERAAYIRRVREALNP